MSSRNRRTHPQPTPAAVVAAPESSTVEPVVEPAQPAPVPKTDPELPATDGANAVQGDGIGQSDEPIPADGVGPVVETLTPELVTDAPLAGAGAAEQITDQAAYPDGLPPPIQRKYRVAEIDVPFRRLEDGYAKRSVNLDGPDAETLRDITAGLTAAGMTHHGALIERPELALSWLLEQVRDDVA